jgi:hypothetical protein
MKSMSKSVFITGAAAGLLLLILAACSDTDITLPEVFGGSEVPAESLNEPRLVAQPEPNTLTDKSWPRLGDVPSKPTNFSSHEAIQKTMQEMEDDRAEGRQLKDEYENPPAVVMTVPIQP